MKSMAAVALACLAGSLSGSLAAAAPAPSFKSVSYDVSLTPDFATALECVVAATKALHLAQVIQMALHPEITSPI